MTLDPDPEEEKVPETDNGDSEPVENQEESKPEENPVMNFFKTLVSDKFETLSVVYMLLIFLITYLFVKLDCSGKINS